MLQKVPRARSGAARQPETHQASGLHGCFGGRCPCCRERDTILAARKAEAEERRAEEASRAAVEAATGQGRGESLAAAAAARQQEQQGQEPTGFVPYYRE